MRRLTRMAGWFILAGTLLPGSVAVARGRTARRGAGSSVSRSVQTRTETHGGVTTVTTTETTRTTINGQTTVNVRTTTQTMPVSAVATGAGAGARVNPPTTPITVTPPNAGQAVVVAPVAASDPAVATASVDAHNQARASQQGANLPPVAWDNALAARASDWAQNLCDHGARFTGLHHRPHGTGTPIGENLAMQGSTEDGAYPVSGAVRQWMSEQRFYNHATNDCSGGECRHYTQVVWRDTDKIGCGSAVCPMGSGMRATVWVCNYSPAGNWDGQRPF